MNILIATRNPGKLKEFQHFLPPGIKGISLEELAVPMPEVEETGQTFQENAYLKAQTIAKASKLPTLADDSGLVVEALGGAPGVYSARYAGKGATDQANNDKLLAEMANQSNRKAHFQAVVAFVDPFGEKMHETGRLDGQILEQLRGQLGFGYDPLFWVDETESALAELTTEQRIGVSHRSKALKALIPRVLGYFTLAKTLQH